MLDGNDIQTFYSLRQLYEVLKENKKPLIFWVGAGASSWCGYPLWFALAEIFHSNFLKTEAQYKEEVGNNLIKTQKFPEFFQYCKNTNKQKYNLLLTNFTKPKSITPVYSRFLENLRSISPLYIITTNVDEMLENNLKGITTIQNSDLERCLNLLQEGQSFVCKIHGSASDIESMVFTTEDYDSLTENK
jgi:NAD-dependent SIR2 family protein deacetylase